MLVLSMKEERLLGFHPLSGWAELVALEGLSGHGKLQYLLTLAHLLHLVVEVPGLHPLLF